MKSRTHTDFLVVHCSATPPSMDIGATEIRRWHRERGFFDIGYHFVIRRDGTVETGRDVMVPGAHVQGINDRSVGVCMVGGVKADCKTAENNFTKAQFDALAELLPTLMQKFPKAKLAGHRDFAAKDCPSFDVQGWFARRFRAFG